MQIFDGQCFCGQIRYRMHGKPLFVHCCHCTDCQRQFGSAFVVNAAIETDRLEVVQGQPRSVELATDSGNRHEAYFCQACNTPLWSDYRPESWVRYLKVASLERPDLFPPAVHVYARSKSLWVMLPENARSFDAYYDPEAVWPAESLERFHRARKAASSSHGSE